MRNSGTQVETCLLVHVVLRLRWRLRKLRWRVRVHLLLHLLLHLLRGCLCGKQHLQTTHVLEGREDSVLWRRLQIWRILHGERLRYRERLWLHGKRLRLHGERLVLWRWLSVKGKGLLVRI